MTRRLLLLAAWLAGAAALAAAQYEGTVDQPAAGSAAPGPMPEADPDPTMCHQYFGGIKPSLDLCQTALATLPYGTQVQCPWQCRGVFKGMPWECGWYVDSTLPETYSGRHALDMDNTTSFDICDMLFCASEQCSLTLDVLRSMALFQLPDSMPTTADSASSSAGGSDVNVGAIVAGVVAGNAVIVLLVGAFLWARRHRAETRVRAAQLKAYEMALAGMAPPGVPPPSGSGGTPHGLSSNPSGAAALDFAERGGSVSATQAMAQLWAQAAAQGAVMPWPPQPPQPGRASPPPSSSTGGASHMQHDELEMMRLEGDTPPARPNSVSSDPLLAWVNSQVTQQDSAGGQALASAGGSRDTGSPPAGGSGPVTPPAAGGGEAQAADGGGALAGQPTVARLASRQRSMALESHRSSGLVDLKPWQLKYSDLRMQRPLGEGSFGKVFLATWNETLVAVKVLLSTDAAKSGSSSSGSLPLPVVDELQKEAGLMASLRHPNVVLFLGVCTSPPAVVTEYCSRGSLLDVLRYAQGSEQAMQQLTWVRRLSMALDAAKGMLCLHAHSPPILHRDLKSPNLLVDAAWRVKVCDFNLSKLMEDSVRSSSAGSMLNPRWLAPEVLMGQPATAASDVFSFGTVLWELLTWQLPWEGANLYQLVFMVSRGERLPIPEQLPGVDQLPAAELEAFLALIRRCWAQEPAERPTFPDIITALRAILTRVLPPTNAPSASGTDAPPPAGAAAHSPPSAS